MKAPSQAARRLLAQLANGSVQQLSRASPIKSASIIRHQCSGATRSYGTLRQGLASTRTASHSCARSFGSQRPALSGVATQINRSFSSSSIALHNELTPPKPGEELHVTFIDKEGKEHTFEVAKGDNLLDIALENDIEMEGACGGSCACSTCHVIVEDEEMYNKMDEPDDDENDMLDLAFGLTETSRLGCQIKMAPELDGLRVKLPRMTRNMQASDFSKKD